MKRDAAVTLRDEALKSGPAAGGRPGEPARRVRPFPAGELLSAERENDLEARIAVA